jgi:hypothetical protein
LYAAVSQIPPNQSVDIPATIWSLTTDLTLPGASDPETRLRILTVRGILQTNQDAAQAHATWEEVEKLATRLHHYEIATRAVGEQGIASFILGDALTAKKQVFFAWTAARPELDPAAQVRYASVYASWACDGRAVRRGLEAVECGAQHRTRPHSGGLSHAGRQHEDQCSGGTSPQSGGA